MTNGARKPRKDNAAPMTGPTILPTKNAEAYNALARPRMLGWVTRTIRAWADNVNMVEPKPAMKRSVRICQ